MMSPDYLTDEEKVDVEQWANALIAQVRMWPSSVVTLNATGQCQLAHYILKLLQELEDLKAELFNGMAERFRTSDARADRQSRIIAIAKEGLEKIATISSPDVSRWLPDSISRLTLQDIAEIEGEK